MLLAIVVALLLSLHIAKKYYQIKKDTIFDLAFFLIIFGLIGARLYDVLLELPYYLTQPLKIFYIWEGGLAIHGAIIAGLIVLYFFAKKRNLKFFQLSALIVPGLALGQAVGRFGNYFNQELFGLPTDLAWGIPISLANRPELYLNEIYFHPTFLYESIGSLLIFLILFSSFYFVKKEKIAKLNFSLNLTLAYLILYSLLRFSLEFIRIDYAPVVGALRWPQIASLAIIVLAVLVFILNKVYYAQKNSSR